MSTVIDHPSLTIQDRNIEATRQLCHALELGAVRPSDMKYLTLALAEVAADMARHDSDFRSRVRTHYTELATVKSSSRSKKQRGSSARKAKKEVVQLEPVGHVDEVLLNPYGPLNPYALRTLYGDAQLALALDRYSATKLKEAVAVVQRDHPGTKPKNMSRKAALIDYIVEHVAGAGS